MSIVDRHERSSRSGRGERSDARPAGIGGGGQKEAPSWFVPRFWLRLAGMVCLATAIGLPLLVVRLWQRDAVAPLEKIRVGPVRPALVELPDGVHIARERVTAAQQLAL